MNAFKRICTLAVAAALCVGCLSGCNSAGDASSSASGDTSTSSAAIPERIDLSAVTDPFLTTSGVAGDTVVATVGELEITADQLLYWIAYGGDSMFQYYQAYGLTEMPWELTAEDGTTLAQTLKDDALDTAVIYAAMPALARNEGVELSEDFQTFLNEGLENMAVAMGGQEIVDYFFWQYPVTPELYAAMCESEEYNALMQEALYGENSEGYPSDADVLAYAEDELGLYSVKHILLATSDIETREPLDEEAVAAQKALAEDLVEQLHSSDDPIALFDQLMQEHSEDPGLAAYPDGYLQVYPGQMVSEFEEASLALEVGEVSGVVEAESTGFHIILRLPLEIDSAAYRQDYVAQLMMERQDKWLADQKVETTQAYERIDAAVYYDTLRVLRESIDTKLAEISAEMEAEAAASSSAGDTSADESASSSAQN